MNNTKSVPNRFRTRTAIVLALLSAVAISAPVAARQGPKPVSETRGSLAEARPPVEARGNWMHEYVQLRLATQNLKYAIGPMSQYEMQQTITPKIVGGTVAGPNDNPFQVGLLSKSVADNFNAQFCGGTLVKANVIVTAAHCSDFVTAGQVQVLTGTRNLDGTGTRRDVVSIAIHPNWNPNTFDYDVAVWTLSSSTSGIPFASLASADPPAGTNLLVTGWGALTEGGSFPIDLRKATVPLVSNTTCNGRKSYGGAITSQMICAGFSSGGVDSCQGDSGGPLTQGSVLTGIVSWGTGCARRNKYGVYSRVSSASIRNFIVTQAGL
jgi:trypsin